MTASLLPNSDKWSLADITLPEAAQAFGDLLLQMNQLPPLLTKAGKSAF